MAGNSNAGHGNSGGGSQGGNPGGNPGDGDPGGGNNRTVTIIVNGRPKPWPRGRITFEEVVSLTSGLPTGENIIYSVTFTRGHPGSHEGTLLPNHDVAVKEGMTFDVSATDKS